MSIMAMIKAPIRRLNIEQRLFSEQRLIKTLKQSAYAAWTALLLIICVLFYLMAKRTPTPPDPTAAYSDLVRVEFFAENYLTLSLTGTPADLPALQQMAANPNVVSTDLNSEPLAVDHLNVPNITADTSGGVTQWVVTIGASLTPPGSSQPQRAFYDVTVISRGGALKALTNPRPVNDVRDGLQVDSAYPHEVSLTSNLGSAMGSFASAYYTSQTGSLGQYISGQHPVQPIIDSPYTSAQIVAIHSLKQVDTGAKKGTKATLLLTIKAALSLTTYQTFDVPVTAVVTNNGQWVVDSMDTLTHFGSTH